MKKIYVMCNIANINLVKPIKISKVLLGEYYSDYLVALYDLDELEKIEESQYELQGAFWREIGRLQISQDSVDGNGRISYQPRVMRRMGLFDYIYDKVNLSTERHIACAIGNFSEWEGKDPIEFFNSLDKLFT